MTASMAVATLLLLLVLPVEGSLLKFSGSLAQVEAKERPVNKVIDALKEIQTKLVREKEEDEKIYDEFVCWCETNEKAKAKSIADNTEADKELTAKIPELAAHSASLVAETAQLEKEITHNEEALAEAAQIRVKEHAEFNTEEKDAVGSVTGMQNALKALSKPHDALLQVEKVLRLGNLRPPTAIQRLNLPEAQKRDLLAMLQESQKQPQSGEIFGMLKGMKESFETNLANSQKEEKDAAGTFAQLKSAKSQEIASARNEADNNKEEVARTDEKREQSKEDLENARKQVTVDQAFLLDLQQRCGSMDKDFADRRKMRNEETQAVSEALEIITSDDAHDLLAKSTRFVQLWSTTHRLTGRGRSVVMILRDAANKLHSKKLAMLVASIKSSIQQPEGDHAPAGPAAASGEAKEEGEDGGVFGPVEAVLDKLTKQLAKEQGDDVAERDFCIDTLNTNEKDLAAKYSEKTDLDSKLEELNLIVSQESDKIDAANAEIAENKKEMKIASEDREQANHEFQTTATEQRQTQVLLAKVQKRLEVVYKAAALVQVDGSMVKDQVTGRQEPPAGFAPYKKSGGAGGVLGMIENIITESKNIETESIAAEAQAQKDYEHFIKDTNDSTDTLSRSVTDSFEAKSKAQAEIIRSDADLNKAKGDIKDLNSFRRITSKDCDFLLKNFEMRQALRTEEIEALEQAKSVMHGAGGEDFAAPPAAPK